MKSTLILLVMLTLSLPTFSQQSDCLKAMKTGEFFYPGRKDAAKIIRKKDKQIEIYNNGLSRLVFKLKWANDSTYVLTLKKKINAPGPLKKGDWIKATITSCEDGKSFCKTVSNNGRTWDGYIQKEED
jgi:hypothetical protein